MKREEQLGKRIDQEEEESRVTVKKRKQLDDEKAILRKLDQGEEEEESRVIVKKRKQLDEENAILKNIDVPVEKKEHQNGMEIAGAGAIVQNRNEIYGGEVQLGRERICESLPEELIIESILTRLPARTLAICCCVSKLWYSSIFYDSRFSVVHYNQNKNKPSLVFNLLNASRVGKDCLRTYFFSLLGGEKVNPRYVAGIGIQDVFELVGFCNGLACVKLASAPGDTEGVITIVNPIRYESLVLSYAPPIAGYTYLCHGFGFDSLSQVYKAVIIFASEANNEYLCMVVTLGTISWRKIITSTFDISPPPGSSPFPSTMVTRIPRISCKPATFCGGDLFWRTTNKVSTNDDKIEMLLSFDLHNEKIHFVRFPTECTPTTAAHERQDIVVDHLLEYKGYPCIARSERITRSNNDHCCHHCDYQTGICCCCYKVHMYILKDKDKQVWIREETFDVQIMGKEGLLPTPLCQYFNISAATPPTRIMTLSDQVLLYWFNGERLIFYKLREKHLKVVECSRSYPSIFRTKMNERLERFIGDDDNIYCPSMDYQLHAQVENIVSLETFIPKEAKTIKTNCVDEAMHIVDNYKATGWLTTGRRTQTFYTFS